MSDEIDFLSEDDDNIDNYIDKENDHWQVLVVDDEEDIHNVTTICCKNMQYAGRDIIFHHAYTGAEAIEILKKTPEMAAILMDVVMETEHAGLDAVRTIRSELGNEFVRIILRTGQPGQAPEEEVILNYDINDYKSKDELTAQRLRTSIYASLRGYRDIMAIEKTKENLEVIINSTHGLFHQTAIREFATNVLKQLTTLLHLGDDAIYYKMANPQHKNPNLADELLVGIGKFVNVANIEHEDLPKDIFTEINNALKEHQNIYYSDHYIAYFETEQGLQHVLYVEDMAKRQLSEKDKHLLEVFCRHVGTAFEVFAPMVKLTAEK